MAISPHRMLDLFIRKTFLGCSHQEYLCMVGRTLDVIRCQKVLLMPPRPGVMPARHRLIMSSFVGKSEQGDLLGQLVIQGSLLR